MQQRGELAEQWSVISTDKWTMCLTKLALPIQLKRFVPRDHVCYTKVHFPIWPRSRTKQEDPVLALHSLDSSSLSEQQQKHH